MAGSMADRVRAFDWATTPLGPQGCWPTSLATLVELMLATPQLATLAVGPERIFLYNDAAAHHYGAHHPAVLGLPLTEAFRHEFHQVAPFYDRVFAGESIHVPAQSLDPAASGTPEVFDAYLTPVRDGDGTVIAAFMTGFAIGDRRRAEAKLRESEERQALLLRLSDTLRIMTDPAEIRRAAMQLLGGQLGLARIYYFDVERDDDGDWVHVIERGFQRDPDQVEFVGRYSLSDFGDWMFEGFARGDVIAVSDIETHPGLTEDQRAAYRAVGVAAFINVPLLRDGEYAAGIGAHDVTPRAWTEAQFDLIREVAARTWTATERARAETAVRDSKDRFRELSDNISQLAWTCDRLGEVTWYNRRWFDYTGLSFDEMKDWGWAKVQHPDHAERVIASVTRSRDSGEPWEDTFSLRRHDGVYRWFLSRAVPTRNAIGGVVHWFGTNTDITEQREMDAALRESEARLSAAFESIPVGLAMLDSSGRTVLANSEYRRFLPNGLVPSRDADRGWRWRAWDVHGEMTAREDFPAAHAVRGERVFPGMEMLYTDDDGREIWTSVASVPVLDAAGAVTGLACVISDIDARKRTEARLRDSEELLRQFGEASQDILWIRDLEKLQWQYLTPAFETIYGLSRQEALTGDNYRNWLDLIVPEDRAHASRMIRRVGNGERVTFEFRIRRPVDGAIRWMRNTDFPILNAAGEVELIGGIGHDATEFREVELRLQALVEGMPQLVWRAVEG